MPELKTFIAAGLILAVFAPATTAFARQGEPPYGIGYRAKAANLLPVVELRPIDAQARRDEADAKASVIGPHAKRLQVADNEVVSLTPAQNGEWTTLADGSLLWRLRVRAAGATDLRLGFAAFALPPGVRVYVIGAGDYYQGPYDTADAGAQGFNAPPVPGDTAIIELRMPSAAPPLAPDALELGRVGAGFRDAFGISPIAKSGTGVGASGACNVNVACPLGAAYPDEIRAVAHYDFTADDDHQAYICTGTLLNDVAGDRRNYFLTAAHCMSSASEAASIVLYWNYQSTQCSALAPPAGGFLNDDQHGGAMLRATRADVDFSLIELAQAPDDDFNVHYAGWDASGAIPSGTVGIHHPSGDVKKITAGPRPATAANCIGTGGSSSNTHWMTGPYSQGTTEGGSSGSGLFIAAADGSRHGGRLIGTLSGGDALCSASTPTRPNDGNDCYGKLAVAWTGSAATARLRDWLDPANSGNLTVAGRDLGDVSTIVRSLPPFQTGPRIRRARP